MKKILNLSLLSLLLFVFATLNPAFRVNAGQSSNGSTDNSLGSASIDDKYSDYIKFYNDIRPDYEIVIQGEDYSEVSEDILHDVFIDYYEGIDTQAVLTPEMGTVSWDVEIQETGYYNVAIVYYPIEGKSSSIERIFRINDEVPFMESSELIFHRIWTDAIQVEHVKGKNDIKPSQIEAPRWNEVLLRDLEGKEIEPYLFKLEEGSNKISLEAIKEPMLIDKIIIYQEPELKTYEEVLSSYDMNDLVSCGECFKVQGEYATEKSSSILYPTSDRSSLKTEPFDKKLIRLNSIGSYNWRIAGDWISWDIEVEKDGLYEISLKYLQNYNRDTFSTRALYIDGKIPFFEASQIEFVYSGGWKNMTIGDENGSYYFYLTSGKHSLSLVNAVGRYGEILESVQEEITVLSDVYREIIMFTSATPDLYRDYRLTERIPDLLDRLSKSKEMLSNVVDEIINISGSKGEQTVVLQKMILQIDDFIKKPSTIHTRLNEFRNNISSLGTWTFTVKEQPLSIDYIVVHGDDYKMPRAGMNFFEKVWHQLVIFFASFSNDYSNLNAESHGSGETIEVWMQTGRDQADVMRKLVDESFTKNTGINVVLKLVNPGVLLPATLSGNGPDVAMQTPEDLPVNYAMRGAIYDISQFDDFESVKSMFYDSAMVPYEYEGGYYALPEQQMFMVMFYRTDILGDLGLEPPTTWDEVIQMVPSLQRYHLDFYLPQLVTSQMSPLFYTLLNQYGGRLYSDDSKSVDLFTDEATDAYVYFTEFYTNYKFVIEANFINRFRSGEMPIGIDYYTHYNTLSVFAPEIRGKWDFAPIPGVLKEDGTIDNRSTSVTSGIVLLENSEKKESGWEFMKWFTSKETQVRYAREMEGVLGAAARYPTANIEALAELPWRHSDYLVLEEQMKNAVGIPVVPGSYITGRYIDTSYRDVINLGMNPRETLFNYSIKINEEIRRKRIEFGLE